MDNKGFTLIELLATIVLLGIVTSITIITVSGSYKNAKEKSETIMISNITKAIDSYIAANINSYNDKNEKIIEFNNTEDDITKGTGDDITKGTGDDGYTASVKSAKIKLENVINTGYLSQKDIVNPNSETSCDINNKSITVYRDSDYVYCFELELNCLTKKINTCSFGK